MKKHGICIVLLYCFLIGACGGVSESGKPETGKFEEVTPPVVTKRVPDSPTPTTAMTPIITSTPSPSKENDATEITTVPIVPGGEITAAVTTTTPIASEEKITASPVPTVTPQVFVLEELGLKSYKDRAGREIYEAATSFFDKNGLLCVGLKAVCETEEELYEVEKTYYLPNAIIYREADVVSEEDLRRLFEGNITKETYITKAYEPIVFETVCNSVWTTEGQLKSAADLVGESYKSKYSCTPKNGYIPVEAGEKLRVTFYFAAAPKIAGILFMDEKDHVIESLSFNSTTQLEGQMIVVPKGAIKMHVSMFANQKYRVERRVELVGADLGKFTEEFYIEQSLKTMLAISKKSTAQYSLDKAYITFVLDDCRPDIDKVADVFEEYSVPLCIAAVHENLLFPSSGGKETRRDVCERVVEQGGEILAHDAEVITEKEIGDYYELSEQFFEDKWILEQMGFDVNGIILAGGSGQLVGHPVTDVFARAFYQYSDLYGEQELGEPYYHRRYWLGNCLDTYKEVIEKAVDRKSWIVFYFHDLNEVNKAKLHEILQYVTSLSEEEAETVTYKTLYDKMW